MFYLGTTNKRIVEQLSRPASYPRAASMDTHRKVVSSGRMSGHMSPVLYSSWPHLSDHRSEVLDLPNPETGEGLYAQHETIPFSFL